MKRRDFLKAGVPFTVLPLALNGMSLRALGAPSLMSALHGAFVDTDHVLVLVQLNGGNDGLNTVIPVDQYSNLSNARSNIMIPQSKVLIMDGVSGTGLHPSMTHLRELFNNGLVNVVQGVGYPDPNFSHFRSTDIWMSGSDADVTLSSGWVGRYLSQEFPNYPDGFPNNDMPDPLAIQIGSVVAPVCQGLSVNMGMAVSDPSAYYQLETRGGGTPPNNWAGYELSYIRSVAELSNAYGQVVKAASDKASNQSTKYPAIGENPLADQLRIVSRLIAGGMKTRIYVVSLGGFDTHASQVESSANTHLGSHAQLLGWVSEAIDAFQDDITLLGQADRVLGMTFSEFGRRIASNYSMGTDHGTAAPMFLFGKHVDPGLTGSNPTIPSAVGVNDNLPMQYDFRSVYASVLRDWFCLPTMDVDTVLLDTFQYLPLLDDSCTLSTRERERLQKSGNAWIMNYPNPFSLYTTIRFDSPGDDILIQVFNSEGRAIKTLVNGFVPNGKHEVVFYAGDHAPGVYYYRYQRGHFQQTKAMQLVR